MTKRGKVLRDPRFGPGLLMAEGQQYLFALDVWKSNAPPKPGLVVEIELDAAGKILGIAVVPESQLAKEQEESALARAQPKTFPVAKTALHTAAGAGLLAISWWFLTAVSIQFPFMEKLDFTFWQVLGFLNAGASLDLLDHRNPPGVGIYGLLAVIALAGPFLQYGWKDRRAALGGLLPLLLMVVVAVAARGSIQNASVGGVPVAGPADVAMKAVSLGFGAYISALASLYLAFAAARQFLAAKAGESHELQPPQQRAA